MTTFLRLGLTLGFSTAMLCSTTRVAAEPERNLDREKVGGWILGGSYALAAMIPIIEGPGSKFFAGLAGGGNDGSSSNQPAPDLRYFIPIVGPFIALSNPYNRHSNMFWSVFSGVGQVTGLAILTWGLASPSYELAPDDQSFSLLVVPAGPRAVMVSGAF